MDYIELAQRTISMLNSMVESGECHTTRTREMMNNAQNGLEQLRQYNVVGRSEQFYCADWNRCGSLCEEQCNACNKAENMPEVAQ